MAGPTTPTAGAPVPDDLAVGTRLDTRRDELGEAFVAVELSGRKHSTLTMHRQEHAVSAVKEILAENLVGPTG